MRCEIPWRNTYFSARSVPSMFHKSEIWDSYSWACCMRRDIFLRRALYLTMFHNSPGCANNSSSPLANCKMSHNVRNVESRMEMMHSLVNTPIRGFKRGGMKISSSDLVESNKKWKWRVFEVWNHLVSCVADIRGIEGRRRRCTRHEGCSYSSYPVLYICTTYCKYSWRYLFGVLRRCSEMYEA